VQKRKPIYFLGVELLVFVDLLAHAVRSSNTTAVGVIVFITLIFYTQPL